jgi:hypothetical protein
MLSLNALRRLRFLLVGAFLPAIVPQVGVAQDRPVAFVHGLFLNSGEWQGTANLLTQQYKIQPIVPTLGWQNTFETQATNLQSALGSLTQAAAMAHSNGGLVLRQYLQQSGVGTHLTNGFTVGTPHRGAPLAQSIASGSAGAYGSYLLNSIVDPFNFYYANDPDFQGAVDNGPLIELPYLMDFMGFVANNFVPILNQVGVPAAEASIPVAPEMNPSSNFIAALNGTANLSAEQAHMPVRVGAATGVSPQNAFFTLFSDDPADWGNVRAGVEYFALLLFDYYSTSDDPFLQANAGRWLNLAEVMYDFDADYLFLNGSVVGVTQGGLVIVQQQDGLVPLSSATWPGGTKQRNLLWPSFSIPHRNQVTDPNMIALMQTVLNTDFGIPVRPPAPSVSMSGPNAIVEETSDTWSATVSSGSPPYTYDWTVDGADAGGGTSIYTGDWAGGTNHTIVFTVTDEIGRVGSAQMNVTVTYSGGGGTCLQPPCQERR